MNLVMMCMMASRLLRSYFSFVQSTFLCMLVKVTYPVVLVTLVLFVLPWSKSSSIILIKIFVVIFAISCLIVPRFVWNLFLSSGCKKSLWVHQCLLLIWLSRLLFFFCNTQILSFTEHDVWMLSIHWMCNINIIT